MVKGVVNPLAIHKLYLIRGDLNISVLARLVSSELVYSVKGTLGRVDPLTSLYHKGTQNISLF